MNKIRIIDLLNKIANGEEAPEKIKYMNHEWHYSKRTYYNTSETELFDNYLEHAIIESLNEEVEVIEDNKQKITKIDKIIPCQQYAISDSKNKSIDERLEMIRKRLYNNDLYMFNIANKLNKIIEVLNDKN